MLKAERASVVDASEIRKNLLSEKAEKPSFKKKLFGFDEKDVEEYIITLNNLLETTKSAFQSENDQMRSDLFLLSKERENYEKQLAALAEERDQFRERCDNELDRIKELYDTISAMELKLTEYDEMLSAKVDVDDLEQKIVVSEELLSAEKAQNAYLTGQNEQLITMLEALRAENAAQKTEISALNLAAKRQQAALEGSLYSYGQDLAEKLERMKTHVNAITGVMVDIGTNCQKTERLIMDKIRQQPQPIEE